MKKALYFILINLISSWSFAQGGYFVKNNGQYPPQVLFAAKLNYGSFFIEKDGFKIKLLAPSALDHLLNKHNYQSHDLHSKSFKKDGSNKEIPGHTFKVCLRKADLTKNFSILKKEDFIINQFLGSKDERWASNLTPINELVIHDIYPSTDLKLYFKGNSIKYEFILSPNANPDNIIIEYQNATSTKLVNNSISISTTVGEVIDEKPFSYLKNTPQKLIKTTFNEIGPNTFSLSTSIKEITETLIIDPQLNFASFTGATLDNWGYTATYDQLGYAYAGGISFDAGYPITLGAFQEFYGGGQIDMSISKFSPDGSSLIYSTYLGGSGLEAPHSMIVNDRNELIIYGVTSSLDYPTSSNAYDDTFNGGTSVSASNVLDYLNGTDIAITKLSKLGNQIIGSTYYGGSENDALNDANGSEDLFHNYADIYRGEVNIDEVNNIYISSVTSSIDLPTPNGFQTNYGGGIQDGCVAKFNNDLSELIWGSYFGGAGADACYASKRNSKGETYITGGTTSNNLTSTNNGSQPNYSNNVDGFLARIAPNGGSITAATYVGTNNYDQSYFVEVDHEDKIYCYGQSSGTMPTTSGVYKNDNSHQFLQKYNEDLNVLEAATIIGSGNGKINISPGALMVSNCKEVYISGWGGLANGDFVGTTGLPVTSDAHQLNTNGSDFYFMLLGEDFTTLKYATFFGGNTLYEHVDGGTSRFDPSGTIYQAVCGGCGGSSAFPVSPTAYSKTNNAENCNLAVIKMDISKLTANIKFTKDSIHCENLPVNFNNQSTGGVEYKWIYPDGSISKNFDGQHYFQDTGLFTISLIAIDSAQCPYSDTANIDVRIIKTPEISIDIDTFLCANNTLTINTTGGPLDTNYTWWTKDTLFNFNTSFLSISPDSTTHYFVNYTNNCGSDTTEVIIPVYHPPTSNLNSDTICEEESPTFQFFQHPNYVITEQNDKSFQLTEDSIVFPKNQTDVYYIKTESSCGSAVDTFNIEFIEINSSAGPDTTVCIGDQVLFFANGGDQYVWESENFGNQNTLQSPQIIATSTGDYIVSISKGGCSELDTASLNVFAKPDQNVNSIYTINYGEDINISLNPNFIYSWSPPTGLDCDNCSIVNSKPDEDITYLINYSDSRSCRVTDSIKINVIFPLYIANTFTPNGDGKNDVFYAYSHLIKEFEITIYDRWGMAIYQSKDINEGWDGTLNGVQQQQDVFVYIVRYTKMHTTKVIERVGTVNLIR